MSASIPFVRARALPGEAEATNTLIVSARSAPEQTRVDSGEFTTPGRYQVPHAATMLRC